jgi:hypothetical protein
MTPTETASTMATMEATNGKRGATHRVQVVVVLKAR